MGLREIKASDIMLKDVITIGPDEHLPIAKLKTLRRGVGGLPVVENGSLLGMITHRDIILLGNKIASLIVRDIMSRNVLSVEEDTSITEIVRLMKETGYQRLPVVRGKKLIGLITQSSIINALAEELG
ncbi:MAG: CBS domain-containing protein [Candidatus Hydrothermarchaeales archaeon]